VGGAGGGEGGSIVALVDTVRAVHFRVLTGTLCGTLWAPPQSNKFTGSLPAGQWDRLMKYDVADNQFTGGWVGGWMGG